MKYKGNNLKHDMKGLYRFTQKASPCCSRASPQGFISEVRYMALCGAAGKERWEQDTAGCLRFNRCGRDRRGKEDTHLTLLLLELDLDVGELRPELLVGSLQGGQGVGPLSPGAAAGALPRHGEAARQGAGAGPAVPALRLLLLAAPRYIFSLACREGSRGEP